MKQSLAILLSLQFIIAAVVIFILFVAYYKKRADYFKEKLEKYQTKTTSQDIVSDDLKRQESELRNKLTAICNTSERGLKMTEEDWGSLSQLINQHYRDFDDNLRSLCKMSTLDYRMCLLFKLEMSAADIGVLTNRTTDGIYKACKKLYLRAFNEKGSSTEWVRVIEKL